LTKFFTKITNNPIFVYSRRRKKQRQKEINRKNPPLPTASEVDRVIIAESTKKPKKKEKNKSRSKQHFDNPALDVDIGSSTGQSSHDYENVTNKKESPYANAASNNINSEPEQAEYMEPLPDQQTVYTNADSGATYYMEKAQNNTTTPKPTLRSNPQNKTEKFEQQDYEEVQTPSHKINKPNKVDDDSDNEGPSPKDYVNVTGMKKR